MNFEEKVRAGFNEQSFMNFIGAELTKVEEGYVQIELPYNENLLQQHGFYHGGVVATLADNAGGFAGHTMMSDNEEPLSIEFKVNLLNPARGERLVAKSKVIKNGRRIKVCEVNIYGVNNGKESHCAVAIVSVIATEQKL